MAAFLNVVSSAGSAITSAVSAVGSVRSFFTPNGTAAEPKYTPPPTFLIDEHALHPIATLIQLAVLPTLAGLEEYGEKTKLMPSGYQLQFQNNSVHTAYVRTKNGINRETVTHIIDAQIECALKWYSNADPDSDSSKQFATLCTLAQKGIEQQKSLYTTPTRSSIVGENCERIISKLTEKTTENTPPLPNSYAGRIRDLIPLKDFLPLIEGMHKDYDAIQTIDAKTKSSETTANPSQDEAKARYEQRKKHVGYIREAHRKITTMLESHITKFANATLIAMRRLMLTPTTLTIQSPKNVSLSDLRSRDPLSIMIRLAMLPDYPVGTKVSVSKMDIHPADFVQGIHRRMNGDSRDDLLDLLPKIRAALQIYLKETPSPVNTLLLIRQIFWRSIQGLLRLRETYDKDKNSPETTRVLKEAAIEIYVACKHGQFAYSPDFFQFNYFKQLFDLWTNKNGHDEVEMIARHLRVDSFKDPLVSAESAESDRKASDDSTKSKKSVPIATQAKSKESTFTPEALTKTYEKEFDEKFHFEFAAVHFTDQKNIEDHLKIQEEKYWQLIHSAAEDFLAFKDDSIVFRNEQRLSDPNKPQ